MKPRWRNRQRARPALGPRLDSSPQRAQRYTEEGRQPRVAAPRIDLDQRSTVREAPVRCSSSPSSPRPRSRWSPRSTCPAAGPSVNLCVHLCVLCGEERALRLGSGTTKRHQRPTPSTFSTAPSPYPRRSLLQPQRLVDHLGEQAHIGLSDGARGGASASPKDRRGVIDYMVHHREHRGTQRKADNRAVPDAVSRPTNARERLEERRRRNAHALLRRRPPKAADARVRPAQRRALLGTSVSSMVKNGPCDTAMARRPHTRPPSTPHRPRPAGPRRARPNDQTRRPPETKTPALREEAGVGVRPWGGPGYLRADSALKPASVSKSMMLGTVTTESPATISRCTALTADSHWSGASITVMLSTRSSP